jgi:arginase
VAGSRLAGGRTGLVYLDMHADLNVPSSVVDGALDWMGTAHMLDVEGCLPELADLASPFVPMLDATQVVVLGHEHSQATDWERSVIAERSIAVVAAEALRAGPAAAAERALAQLADATSSTSWTRRSRRTPAATWACRWRPSPRRCRC